jgi:hypothetical protein
MNKTPALDDTPVRWHEVMLRVRDAAVAHGSVV